MLNDNIRILVISNEAFSKGNSNGRTIMNLLSGVNKKNLAQFYIHGVPDDNFCSADYHNSDSDALRAYFHLTKQKSIPNKCKSENKKKRFSVKRSSMNHVLRDLIWQSWSWWSDEFNIFLENFRPNIVLLQAGDAPFMYALALKIAKRYKAKLIMFNTEAYVLKRKIYSSVSIFNVWHMILKYSLRHQYQKYMEQVSYCIYNTEALELAYQKKYPHKGKSSTLYTSSDMPELISRSSGPFSLLYCGNLGVGRDEVLNQVAEILFKIDHTACIDVYGKFNDHKSQQRLCANKNINYHGFIDYKKIPALMSKASMLIHCEKDERVDNLRFAFSTKIADCLSSTCPFLVYASREYPFVQYLQHNKCAHIASGKEELELVLRKCIDDIAYRNKYRESALIVSRKYHNFQNNVNRVNEIFTNVLYSL